MGQLLSPAVLISLGLALDIAGGVLLYRFGLPVDEHPSGGTGIRWGEDPENAKCCRRAVFWSRVGLGLLIAGFGLQIAGNHAGARAPAPLPAVPCAEIEN